MLNFTGSVLFILLMLFIGHFVSDVLGIDEYLFHISVIYSYLFFKQLESKG